MRSTRVVFSAGNCKTLKLTKHLRIAICNWPASLKTVPNG